MKAIPPFPLWELTRMMAGILMRTAECADDKLAAVRSAYVDRNLGSVLDKVNDRVDIRKVNARVNALCAVTRDQKSELKQIPVPLTKD